MQSPGCQSLGIKTISILLEGGFSYVIEHPDRASAAEKNPSYLQFSSLWV